jgi:hypothetical protein
MFISVLFLLIAPIVGIPDYEFQGVYVEECSNTTFSLQFSSDKTTNIINITYSQNITFCDSEQVSYHSRLIGRCRNGYTMKTDHEISCNSTYWEPAYPQQIYIMCRTNQNSAWTCSIKFYNDSIMNIGPMYLKNSQPTNQTNSSISHQSSGHIPLSILMLFLSISLFAAIA